MRRRDFILAGGASLAWPFAAAAQELGRAYRVGGLSVNPRNAPNIVALFDALQRLGFIEGGNLTIDWRAYDPRADLVSQFEALGKAQADVIYAGGNAAIRAAQKATTTIPSRVAWTTLRNLHVPENRRVKLEDVTDVLSKGGRLKPFPPRHVRHFAESHLLDFVGPKLPSRLIGRSHPVGDELLQLRDVRPAVPAALPAREAQVHGWINDVSPLQPSMEQVPAALVGCLLTCARNEHR